MVSALFFVVPESAERRNILLGNDVNEDIKSKTLNLSFCGVKDPEILMKSHSTRRNLKIYLHLRSILIPQHFHLGE